MDIPTKKLRAKVIDKQECIFENFTEYHYRVLFIKSREISDYIFVVIDKDINVIGQQKLDKAFRSKKYIYLESV